MSIIKLIKSRVKPLFYADFGQVLARCILPFQRDVEDGEAMKQRIRSNIAADFNERVMSACISRMV